LLLCLGNSLIPFSAQTRDWSRSSSSLFIAGVGAARARRLCREPSRDCCRHRRWVSRWGSDSSGIFYGVVQSSEHRPASLPNSAERPWLIVFDSTEEMHSSRRIPFRWFRLDSCM
jgi:hypothetical protein